MGQEIDINQNTKWHKLKKTSENNNTIKTEINSQK